MIPLTLTSNPQTTSPQPGLFASNPATLQLQTRSTLDLTDYEVALASLDCQLSWPNVQAIYGNTTMSYVFNGTTYSFSLVPGGYEIADINAQLQLSMQANGLYLVSTDSSSVSTNVYFLSFVYNPVYLTTTITSSAVPKNLTSSNGTTLTNPNNITLSGVAPSLIVSSAWSSILGFAQPGTYPAVGATASQYINGTTPSVLNPVNYVCVTTNLVCNPAYNASANAIHTFVPQGGYGSQLSVTPNERVWYPVSTPQLTNVTVTLTDQNGNPLPLISGLPITITLYLRRSY